LFWKNKKSNEITIEFDSGDKRHGVRIKPLDEIIIHHEKYQSRLIDISAIGLSFKADESNLYQKQDGLEVSIMLPDELSATQSLNTAGEEPLVCIIKIIYVAKTSYHCQIIQIDRDAQILLDRYILNEQKRQIHLHSR